MDRVRPFLGVQDGHISHIPPGSSSVEGSEERYENQCQFFSDFGGWMDELGWGKGKWALVVGSADVRARTYLFRWALLMILYLICQLSVVQVPVAGERVRSLPVDRI